VRRSPKLPVTQPTPRAMCSRWQTAPGRRQVLAVELANRGSRSSWRDFLLGRKVRGLHGVEFVVADDHAGLRAAQREIVAEAVYQRCYVHFLINALDNVPGRVDDDWLQELRWLYDRPDVPEARRDLAAWLAHRAKLQSFAARL
jgi:putative transposase